MARSSFSRSKGSRRPAFLTTVSSRSCTRSKVVKRPPHAGHRRRRRIAALSSEGRESFTWVSSWPQNGQRMNGSSFPSLRVDGEAAAKLQHLGPDACFDDGIAFLPLRGDTVDDIHDHPADPPELAGAEAARGPSR